MTRPLVLVADDRDDVREALQLLLKPAGFDVTLASTPDAAVAAAARTRFDAALVDLNYARETTSGAEGLALLERLRRLDARLPIVAMTAWGTIEGAVVAMQQGARDYVQKPWDNARLLAALAEHTRARPDETLLGSSSAMREVLAAIDRVAPSSASVLVTGEHGTGKELVARRLHDLSPRRARPFVVVDAGTLAAGLVESALFGHKKGAFTDAHADRPGAFALADAGTLFLDEIGNMPVAHQAKLLRALQTGEFTAVGGTSLERADVRVVAATNADLALAVRQGSFREDLLYRLNAFEIRLPPLRARTGDVALLARHFVERARLRDRRAPLALSPDAIAALAAHPWPGNIRELEHAIERGVLFARGERIEANDLALAVHGASEHALTLEEAEAAVIERAIARANGNVTDAARALGLSRSALYRRLQQRTGKPPR